MRKIWIFGDSFASDDIEGSELILEMQWHRILARELEMSVENRALGGTSLEWVYYTFHHARRAIAAGDLIIAVLTEVQRRWLLRDKPTWTVPWCLANGIYDEDLESHERRALKHYFTYLDHDTMSPSYLNSWLYNLDDLVRQRSCSVLIIPAYDCSSKLVEENREFFPALSFAHGDLIRIAVNEYVPELRDIVHLQDGRANHMSVINHKILARKIKDWYQGEGVSVDLTTGFHENVIDRGTLNRPDMFAREHKFKPI